MFDFVFEHIIKRDRPVAVSIDEFSLWILHADKIPPHVGVSIGNEFYSLKANGKDEGVKLDKLVSLLTQKQIAAFSVKLSIELNREDLISSFGRYSTTVPGRISCLEPIKRVLKIENASKLSELLEELSVADKIIEVAGYNTHPELKGVLAYSVDDIYNRLEYLVHAG